MQNVAKLICTLVYLIRGSLNRNPITAKNDLQNLSTRQESNSLKKMIHKLRSFRKTFALVS